MKLADCGEFAAFPVVLTAPLRVPTTVGVKLTARAQLAPAASVRGQLLV
jgi:hypothetical protein